MTHKKFHLAWFLNQGFGPGQWASTWRGQMGKEWYTGEAYVNLARRLEAACFDYLLIEDTSYVPQIYGGSWDKYMASGYSTPKLDATVLASTIARETSRLGICTTMTTTEWNPYLLARTILSLDHVSRGRIGWNIVTGGSPFAAKNLGHEDRLPHAERYARADEFTDLVQRIWDSWEPDALVTDVANKVLVDGSKLHTVDFEGKWFKSRGPINVPPSPQGAPVRAQAGASPAGMAFGGKWADTILAGSAGPEANATFLQSVRQYAVEAGRKPSDVKVLFIVTPYLGDTEAEARASFDRQMDELRDDPSVAIASMSTAAGFDFSTIDWDTPIGNLADEIQSEHIKSALDGLRGKGHLTLREIVVENAKTRPLIGTPEQVADTLIEWNDSYDGDGYLFMLNQMNHFNYRALAEVIDGLVPALQEKGAVRTEYEFETLRDNLKAF